MRRASGVVAPVSKPGQCKPRLFPHPPPHSQAIWPSPAHPVWWGHLWTGIAPLRGAHAGQSESKPKCTRNEAAAAKWRSRRELKMRRSDRAGIKPKQNKMVPQWHRQG